MPKIPFVDLKAQYHAIKSEIDAAVSGTIEASAFIMGERVSGFEKEFAEFCGVAEAVGCSSGTTALHLALLGCGVRPGDEVITVSHTFIATAEAITHCGATPMLVEIDAETYNLDPARLEAAITPKTRVIIPVHLYGQCVDLDPILAIAAKHKLKVVEDAAQAHGAEYKGRKAGSIGDFGCFSFFPGKNLGAYGDAGAVTTRDAAMGQRLRMLANHGRTKKYEHDIVGYNYRMDALQAAILRVKLRHLPAWTAARRRLAHRYSEKLAGLPLVAPREKFGHVYHLYVIQCDDREALAKALKEKEIETGIHYPIPLHLQPCYKELASAGQGRLPITERVVYRILSLPIFAEMTDEQQDRVVAAIREFYRK